MASFRSVWRVQVGFEAALEGTSRKTWTETKAVHVGINLFGSALDVGRFEINRKPQSFPRPEKIPRN